MDYQDMLEKMSAMNKKMLCTMLGVVEPPENVCRHYFNMKKCLDKISAPISPVDLLRIAMDVGFNPETRLFENKAQITKIVNENTMSVADQKRILEARDGDMIAVDGPQHCRVVDLTGELTEPVDLNAETVIEEAAATGGSLIGEEELDVEETGDTEEKLPTVDEVKAKIDANLVETKADEAEVKAEADEKQAVKDAKKDKAEAKNQALIEEQTDNIVLIEDGSEVDVYLDGEPAEGVVKSGKIVAGVAMYQVEIEGAVHELSEDDVEK